MKYQIGLNSIKTWYEIDTNFVVTETIVNFVKMCKGVDFYSNGKYRISFAIGEMFNPEEVKQSLTKVLDAYIKANPSAGNAEDKAIRDFAEENEQFKFLSNYK